MLKIDELQKLQAESNRSITVMQSALDGVNDLVAQVEKDSSRSQAYKSEKIQAKRAAIMPILTNELAKVRDCSRVTNASKQFWDSKPLLLSLEKYSEDLGIDASVKAQRYLELNAMSPGLLDLTFKNAVDEANLALVYQCWLMGHSKRIAGDKTYVEIANLPAELEIPFQKQALAAIMQCWSNVSFGESLAAVANGSRLSPSQKITVSREQQMINRFVEASA